MTVAPPIGAVSDIIPIVVSPGRRHVEPRLSLTFNSMSGSGLAGLGWHLETGKVERWRGDGTPTVGDSCRFSYSLSGAGGQLRDIGGGVYRATMESVYREFLREGDGWVMRDGEGLLHYFGRSAGSRVEDKVWKLDLVQDRSGNTISYSYIRENGALYPSEIRYTGFASTGDPGANSVQFEYEDRPDVRISYQYGVRETQSLRLSRISVFAGGELVRRYELEYEQSPLNGQSLLLRVVLVGADDASRVTLRTLEYGSRSAGWSVVPLYGTIPLDFADSRGRDTGARVSDVNGDGFADVLGRGEGVYLGDGSGHFTKSDDWSEALGRIENLRFVNNVRHDAGARLVDVNSDARPDVFIARSGLCEVWLNTGEGWALDEKYTASADTLGRVVEAWADSFFLHPSDPCDPPHCDGILGHFPGCRPVHCAEDSVADCDPVHCEEDSIPGCRPPHCEQHNAGYDLRWEEEVFAFVDEYAGRLDSKGTQLADVNGDGRVDIIWSMLRTERLFYGLGRTPVHLRGVFLNTGSVWKKNDELTEALWSVAPFVTDSQLGGFNVMDVNSDGFADIVRTHAGEDREVWLGTGDSWAFDSTLTNSLAASGLVSLGGGRGGQGLTPVDFDDDGLVDYIQANDSVKRGYHNTGMGWEEASQISAFLQTQGVASISNEVSDGVVFADVDGDGISDILRSKEGTSKIFLSSTVRSDLLVRATCALGEVTEIEWAMSSSFDNHRLDGLQGLPVTMPVATALTRHDGRGHSHTTTYHYSGGLFGSRQFKGFASCEQSPTTGLRVVTHYHQEEGLVGQVEVQEGYDSLGRLRLWKSSTYETVSPIAQVTQVRLVQTDQKTIDPEGFVHRRVTNTFDDRMNYVSVLRDPDVNVPGDEATTEFTWARNDSVGIWSLAARVKVRDPSGAVVKESIILYDGLPEGEAERGLPSEAQDLVGPGQYVTRYIEYDQYGNVIRVQDRDGYVTEFEYDDPTSTFRTRGVDPEWRELRSEYDPRFGELLRDVDASGNAATSEYDVFGRLVKGTLPGDESSPFGTKAFVYSPLGDPGGQFYRLLETEVAGESGAIETTYFFDGMGLIYRVEREGPEGRKIITLTEYDDAGNVVETSRPFFEGDAPIWSTVDRDDLHRPVNVVEPDGIGLTLTHAGPRADLLDRRGSLTSFLRNGDGKVTEIHQWVDSEHQVTRYGYDIFGRITSVVDALNTESRVTYDALGRRVRLEDVNAGTYEYRYSGEDRLIQQTGPDGLTTRFEYNRGGDLVRKIFPDGTVTEFVYGLPGDDNGVGRIVQVRDASGVVDVKYDARGNVTERRRTVDRRTYVTGYEFDSMDRIRRVTYPDGFTANYEYDSGGNLACVKDGDGREVASYSGHNAAGQIGNVGFGNGVQSSFVYDELLRMTSIRTLTSGGEVIQSLDYAFDPGGNILAITDGAFGASQTFDYDEVGRLIHATGAYGEESYEYDAIGNLLRKGDLAFEIDPNHPQRVIRGVEYALGHVGAGRAGKNRESGSGSGEAILLDGGPKSRDTAAAMGGATGPNKIRSFGIAYDLRGNVIRKGDTSFEYDSENHLVRVRNKTGKTIEENIYDAGGQRVIQRTRQGTTIFIDGIYEENNAHSSRHVRACGQLVATVMTPRSTVRLIQNVPGGVLGGYVGDIGLRPSHLTLLASLVLLAILRTLVATGIWARLTAGLTCIGSAARRSPLTAAMVLVLIPALLNATTPQPVYGAKLSKEKPKSEKRYYYHSNHLGSTNAVTNDRAEVIERREYKPYGDPFDWTGPQSGPRELLMTYDGHRYDDATGLYYFGARHYDPEIGRFLTADTEVPDPMNPKTLHRYAFAGGNPIRYSDPTGHGFWDVLLGIVIVVAAFVIGAILIIVTFGAACPILIGLTLALAFLGAGAFGSFALSKGFTPLDSEFWLSVASGFILGAAVGAGLACLPGALGLAGSTIGAIASGALFGAMCGGIEQTIAHFSSGGGPETLLEDLVMAVAIGAVIGAVTAGAGKLFKAAKAGKLAKATNFTKLALKFVGKAAIKLSTQGALFYYAAVYGSTLGGDAWALTAPFLFYTGYAIWSTNQKLAQFCSSPRKNLGIPDWAFAGTWPGMAGGGGRSQESAMLQTMPFAP